MFQYPGNRGKSIGAERIPGTVRVGLWFGLELESDNFRKSLKDAHMAIFAETVSSIPVASEHSLLVTDHKHCLVVY